ncbi:ribosomal protein S12 methylthiotransferase RimO [Christensenellaceae bacterium]|nr:ribosomal protein S12 methylthiotransferase RimO [Christensenellaceae bacterium]BDF61045.1 ribosomal protein S12 methylthiotransferase RimO [Christensenellaceae bacterium]
MAVKIGVISLGCAKNRMDTELMLSQLAPEYAFVQDIAEADIMLINTCAFTDEAKEESINTILEAEQQKKFGNVRGIVVTGCLPQRFREELAETLPRVDAFLGTAAYKDIRRAMDEVVHGGHFTNYADVTIDEKYHERIITTVAPTAYVRIAEGCDNCCSYCVIPSIRGRYQSRRPQAILDEIRILVQKGFSEIILIAQDTTNYGSDLEEDVNLAYLMDQAAQIDGVKWLRVLYSYPNGVTDELLTVMLKHDNIVKYIDIPVQHLDNEVLGPMNRRNTRESTSEVVQKIHAASPDFIIRSTVIVGFPGETRENVSHLCSTMKKLQFDRLGVFTYSQEEHTPAADMADQIDEEEKEFRKDSVLNVQASISLDLNKKRIGRIYEVLIEGKDEHTGLYYGRSYAEAPDVDGKIFVETEKELESGKYYNIMITKAYSYDCIGELTE